MRDIDREKIKIKKVTAYATEQTVIALGGLLAELLPLGQELVLGEGNAVDACELLVLGIAEPVGLRVL